MTSPSRRKRRTTAPAPTCLTRTPAERTRLGAASLGVLALLALAGLAPAQQAPVLGPPQSNQPDVIAKPANWSVPRPPTVRAPAPVVPVRYQQPAGRGGRPYTSSSGDDEGLDYQIQLEPPGLERL